MKNDHGCVYHNSYYLYTKNKKKTKNQRKRAPKGRSQVGMCEMKVVE
jgi:hypothetical protein